MKGLNLTLRRGETFALIGPSGEGKSLCLKMMAGLVSPDRGTVLFHGAELGKMRGERLVSLRRRIGMTFQKSGLFDSLSCGENLRFPLRELLRLTGAEAEARVARALEDVGLSGTETLMVSEMSGGMQKRLGIARALVLSPEAILYDDPTAGLDPVTSGAIIDLILAMKHKYEMTVVLVTSDPVQAMHLSDRIGFLYQGDFAQIGTPDEIRGSEVAVVRQFVLGLPEGPLTAPAEVARD